MHSLRSDFGRIMKAAPSGSGVEGQVDTSKLHYKDKELWDRMCFLQPYVKKRTTEQNFEVDIYEINNYFNSFLSVFLIVFFPLKKNLCIL